MEPERVVVLLVLASGCSAWLGGRGPALPATGSGIELEVRAWRALVAPLVPLACALTCMVGWAAVEPEPADETPPATVIAIATVYGIVVLRALVRLLLSASRATTKVRAAGVTGLVSPRVWIDPAFAAGLDPDEREAVLAHEAAHAAGRDPLRILLARFAADLQWPQPSAATRLARWRHALELRRDEDALRAGADGPALASAILAGAQLGDEILPTAGVGAGELRARVERLLGPPPIDPPRRVRRHWLVLGAPLLVLAGAWIGDPVVAWLCTHLP